MTRSLRSSRSVTAVALGALLPLAACEAEPPKPAPAPAPPPAAAPAQPASLAPEAKAYYAEKCTECHGPRGAGNGIKSDTFVPPPRNFQDPGWQAEVKDDYLQRVIVEGGEAVGKSKDMPGHPDLAENPELAKAVVQYVRTFDD